MRNPPSFCNVVGLRPSPGRIPRWPSLDPWEPMNVLGPMARDVEDVALLLSVMAGPDARDPLSIEQDGISFATIPERSFDGVRVAWSPDLGSFPVQRDVLDVLEPSMAVFSDLGCDVETAHPELGAASDIFQTLRAHAFAKAHAHELDRYRDQMKDTVIWNIEKGLALSAVDVGRAELARAALQERVRTFFERFEFLLLPVSQVTPFDVETPWVTEIEGVELETYIDWMKSCFFITLTAHPALAAPAGFTPSGLPVGLQIVGRYRRELDVLALGRAFVSATGAGRRRPSVC